MSGSTSLVDHVVRRLERELGEVGVTDTAYAVEVAREALLEPDLRKEEESLLEYTGADPAIDSIAAVLASRIEHALDAGIAAAGLPRDALPPLEALVVREPGAEVFESEGARITTVISRWKRYLAERASGHTGRLFVLVTPALFARVQKVLPEGQVGGVSLALHAEGAPDGGGAASIEVVATDVHLEAIESRARELLRLDRLESRSRRVLEPASEAGEPSEPGEPDEEPPEPRADEPPAAPAPEPAPTEEPRADFAADAAEADADPMIGQLFHLKYRIVRCLGRGGFGAVYEAEDERGAGNRVAIKVLFGAAAESAAAEQSFKEEARRVTRLSHPNVVDWKVFDETEDGTPYFVMEMVEGEEFEETLRRERRIEPARAARLLLQVLDALRAAHHLSKTESILHLDLKPANLLRIAPRSGREEQLKVLDFGIGQYIGDGEVRDEAIVAVEGASDAGAAGGTLTFRRQQTEGSTPVNVTRSRGCTPEYASPEQCDHVMDFDEIVPLDGRSDLYSLGVVAFEMLTGQLPFKAKNRLDVLQMHRRDPAPDVGSMGVRVPRRLATFVDRCLRKDRDDRWRDTNEAYQYLREIVHPPVWKAVAKVTVPIVLLAAAIGAWAWTTRERVVPEVGLIAADGADLGNRTVYLGPARTSTVFELSAPKGVVPQESEEGWRVLDAADGTELEGWSAEWSVPRGVSLRPLAPGAGRTVERMELVLGEDRLRTQEFGVVWIGDASWDVAAVRLGGRDLDAVGDLSVDPLGLALDVDVSGEARGDLLGVRLRVGDGEPLSLSPGTSTGARSSYRLELGEAGLAPGPNRLHLSVVDRAGREWTRSTELEVVEQGFDLAGISIVDAAGERGADGELPESNRILEAYLVTPRTRPTLRVRLTRPGDVNWRLFLEGADQSAMRGQVSGRKDFEIDLEGLDRANGGEPFLARIDVRCDEEAYVLHAEGSGRGRVARAVRLRFEDTLPTFAARWRSDDVARPLSDGDDAILFTARAVGALLLTREEPVPMYVEAAWWPAGSPDDVRSVDSTDLLSPQSQQAILPVTLDADGEWSLRIRSHRFDSAAQAATDLPDFERTYRLVLDRTAPGIAPVGLAQGQVLTSLDDAPAELRIDLDGAAPGPPEPGVALEWTLERARGDDGRFELVRRGALEGHDPRSGGARIDLRDALGDAPADGDHRLRIAGVDLAGNAIPERSVEFAVAFRGPEVSLTEPSGVGKWRRDPAAGRWLVRALVVDPNGVDGVSAKWVSGDLEIPIPLEVEPGSSPRERAVIGAIAFPSTLSESKVRLALEATDVHGARSVWTSDQYELPTIAPPIPAGLAVSVGGEPVAGMRLVRGNAGFRYYFGGRGDEVENGAFVRAGLGPFNESPRRSRSRSWQVPFAAGEIEDFYLDEHEVTVGEYLVFLRSPRCADPACWAPAAPPDPEARGALAARLEALDPALPVTGVAWHEARAYANWAGKRLPSWVEWEYAVRGGAEYRPYSDFEGGGESSGSRAVHAVGAAAPAGTGDWTPDTRIADLCGNVSEWTATGAGGESGGPRYPHLRALADPRSLLDRDASGSAYWIAGAHYGAARVDFTVADVRSALTRDDAVGFRCALSLSDVQDRLGLEHPSGPAFMEQP